MSESSAYPLFVFAISLAAQWFAAFLALQLFEDDPPPKFGRILWPRLLADQVAIRDRGGLPDPEEYLDYAKARIEGFFGAKVPESNESNLRRFKKALYDGETELPWDKRARKSSPD